MEPVGFVENSGHPPDKPKNGFLYRLKTGRALVKKCRKCFNIFNIQQFNTFSAVET